MTTHLTMSGEDQADLDRQWARWLAAGARRSRKREKRAKRLTIVIAFVLGVWLAKVLMLG